MKKDIKNANGVFARAIRAIRAIVCGIVIIAAIISSVAMAMEAKAPVPESGRTYACDYKTLSLNTDISFEMDGDTYHIKGNILRFLTDPLTMYDSNGNVFGCADDTYHIVNQDDHTVVVNGKTEVIVIGDFKLLGNRYELFGQNGEQVGTAEFDTFCLNGTIKDVKGNIVATYKKPFILNDYEVTIYDNDMCSDAGILMVVASYVSDYHADNRDTSTLHHSSSN